jgi:hypothetical protein
MQPELKNEFVEHSALIISSSVLDRAPKLSPRSQNPFVQCIFQQPASSFYTPIDNGSGACGSFE